MGSWLLTTVLGVAGLVFTPAGLLVGRRIGGFVGGLVAPPVGTMALRIEARRGG